MISLIQPIAVGNALRLLLSPPAGATRWKLLRKSADTFTGHDDPDAYVALDGTERSVLDSYFLVNGTPYWYKLYSLVAGVYVASDSAMQVPSATYADMTTDVLETVRDRLDYGFQVEVARENISHENNRVSVLTAPPVFEDTRWPVVTVQLVNESPVNRAIGEMVDEDRFLENEGQWEQYEGWHASVQLSIGIYSLNPDERIELRKALRRIVIGNLPVFDESGMLMVELQTQDTEDFTSYSAPVYMVMATFTCVAPAYVGSRENIITDIVQTIVEQS